MKNILASILILILLCMSTFAQPTPSTPPSPESLGYKPAQPSASIQTPPTSESQAVTATTQASAKSAAPISMATAPSSTKMIVPQGTSAPNYFYIPYYASTTASCYFDNWVPMYLDVRGTGQLYTYEWYPNGKLVTQSMAYIPYPGWQKMWFYGDAPGWHTLQYYCNGWSNYIYVYVYGSPSYPPGPTPYSPAPAPGCTARIIITSDSMKGYSVYVDGNYKGGDGQQGDPRDGTFSFTASGNQQHTIKVYHQGFSYAQTKTYNCGNTYYIQI
ncbi:MAG: hypothetical protein MUO26_10835 [Methanotrichaceae archaeon]|nr:hypothetical protein [Methanotrichaceae archaeon]